MRTLILGFNGFIGRSIGHFAQASGHTVYGMSRSPQSSSATEVIYIAGDRADANQVKRLVQKHQIDAVVDVIPMVSANTQPLLNSLDQEVGQFVMISSADVYANYELLHRRGSGLAKKHAVDESSALRTTLYPYRGQTLRASADPDKYLDDYDKIPIEASVRELSSPWTILRLPMVYGPGDKLRRFRWAIAPMLAGEDKLTTPAGWANWQSTYGFIDNVGATVAATLGNDKAFNQVFNVAEEKQCSHFEWANRFASVIGWNGRVELTDDPDHSFLERIAGLNLDVPLKIDGSKLRRDLGYTDAVSEETALERTVESEMRANR